MAPMHVAADSTTGLESGQIYSAVHRVTDYDRAPGEITDDTSAFNASMQESVPATDDVSRRSGCSTRALWRGV